MAILQGGAARRLDARGAEKAACGALALTPLSFLCIALAASDVTSPSPLAWLWIGLILFALCEYPNPASERDVFQTFCLSTELPLPIIDLI